MLGLARSGRAAAELAAKKGYDVVGLDLREDVQPIPGVSLQLGPHDLQLIREVDGVIPVRGCLPPRLPCVLRWRRACLCSESWGLPRPSCRCR